MKKLKTTFFLGCMLAFGGSVIAQSVDEGKRFLYYERNQSANTTLNKVLAANPNDDRAAFYNTLALVGLGKKAEAQQFISGKNQSAPFVMVAQGYLDLLNNKKAEARNKFEAALSTQKKPNEELLQAIGYVNVDAKNGDADYAIAKLTEATQIKKANSAEVWTTLGDAYFKKADGSNAIRSYNQALTIDPNYARALYRSGKIYQTQGVAQEQLFMKFYNDALAKDPKYSPVYSNLYGYYYETDVPKSAEYLDKWLANSDDDPKACYYRAAMQYAQGLFTQAISKADQCIAAEGNDVYPNLYGIKALAYNRTGDSVQARQFYEKYFDVQDPDKIGGGDYSSYAGILLKFPGNEAKAAELVNKAISLDTLPENQVTYIKRMASAYEEIKDYEGAGNWYSRVLNVKPNYTNLDIFNTGYAYYQADQLDSTIKYFNLYSEKYPDDIMGHYMLGNASAIKDSTGELGLAIPHYTKVIEIAEKDLEKSQAKNRAINAYKFFIGYYYNTKKDQATSLQYVDKALAIAPDDQSLIQLKDVISKNNPQAAAPRPAQKK